MSAPTRLERPTLDANPYINYIFHDHRVEGMKHIIPHAFTRDAWDFDDKCFNKALFASAERVGEEQLAALSAMSDDTFQRLVGRFRAVVNDGLIRNREDLAISSAFTEHEHPGATEAQIQAFLLHGARHTFEIHWGYVADVYNESSPGQQQAICDFFDNFLNRQLPELMKTKGPGPVPEPLRPILRSQDFGPETKVQCHTYHGWVREDVLAERFSVEARRMNASTEYHLLAYASTLDEVFAQATAYITNLKAESELYSIQVSLHDVVICSSRLISAGTTKSLPGKHRLPVRVDWGRSASKDVSNEDIRKAAIKAESHFGVRWSLVKKLEDELGL